MSAEPLWGDARDTGSRRWQELLGTSSLKQVMLLSFCAKIPGMKQLFGSCAPSWPWPCASSFLKLSQVKPIEADTQT